MGKIKFLVVMTSVFIAGCASTRMSLAPGASVAQKGIGAQQSTEIVCPVAGFLLFEDKRPKQDIEYMASIRENVSSKILDAIKSTENFSAINFPALPTDTVVISGEIRKFNWEAYDTMISYIPVMNVFNLFGLPATRTKGEVEIYVEVKDLAANKVIFSFVERYSQARTYNIYNYKPSKASENLVKCFEIVLGRIPARFQQNREIFTALEHAKPKIKEAPKEQVKETIIGPQTEDAMGHAAPAQPSTLQAQEVKPVPGQVQDETINQFKEEKPSLKATTQGEIE